MEHVLDDGMKGQAKAESDIPRTLHLEDIDSPADLRQLPLGQLPGIAREIREFLVDVAAHKGGHFAPSLGVVELTLALHYVFDTPRDLLVWDVGHQAYAHKLLTSRRARLHTIRQDDGLSGFLKRSESEYDAFGAGHASTAPSAALGMAAARDIKGDEDRHVVAVIGDGAMTGGLAFEALNNAGALGSNLLVVLNDNAMSISPNVGAVAHYLTTLTTHPYYRRMKGEIHSVLEKIPHVGPAAGEFARRLEQGLKGAVVPGAMFQSLGFTYLGPIDGHDIDELVDVLQRVRDSNLGPVLLHALTQKGKGYAPAEADPVKWHGVTPFDPATGDKKAASAPPAKKSPPSYTSVFADALIDLAERREEVVAITAAMPTGTGLDRFGEKLPNRYFDVGIAEGHAVTFAAGLATQGLRPVCAIYSTFLQRAFDHVIHDVALQKLPVIFALDRGGLVGADGPTHHGTFDLAYLRMIPGMVLAAPKDADELADLLETASLWDEGPFALRYPRGAAPAARSRAPRRLEVGSWEDLGGEGRDVTFLAVGAMIEIARETISQLDAAGLSCRLINARFIKPLDHGMLARIAQESRLVVTLEEGTGLGGFGSAVLESAASEGLSLADRLLLKAVPDRFIRHGSRGTLLEDAGLSPSQVAQAVLERLNGS